jgi:hypothetical protein
MQDDLEETITTCLSKGYFDQSIFSVPCSNHLFVFKRWIHEKICKHFEQLMSLIILAHITKMGTRQTWAMVNAFYGVDKKLSQFDNFHYLWNFDISLLMFGKHFVTKIFN